MATFREFLSNVSAGFPTWCRPLHRGCCQAYISGGNSCCICVPSTATCFVIEMWGQGGGGGGGCCCMWGVYGGQGGDYGWVVCTTSGTNHIFCACACQCAFCNPGSGGHQGQFMRVTQCNAPSCIWCVRGGTAGCNLCCWGNPFGATCGGNCCNAQYNTHSWGCCKTAVGSSSSTVLCNFAVCLGQCTTINACAFAGPGSGTISSSGIDTIFAPVTCSCFNFYRRGACGWSWGGSDGVLAPYSLCNCGNMLGIGGASYAGADQHWETNSCARSGAAYCRATGKFPGGGGGGSGVCGGGCCCGASGGDGLILISWS